MFAWLRIAFAYIAFIWVTSLFVPALADSPRWSRRQRGFARAGAERVVDDLAATVVGPMVERLQGLYRVRIEEDVAAAARP